MRSLRTAVTVLATAASLTVAGTAASEPAAQPELAFVRGATIHLVRADGTGLRAVTRGYRPAWSPDGGRLVFVRENGGNADIFVADADGRNVRRLTRTQGGDVTPSWSPDGTRIAFASNRRGLYRIYVMRADGSRVQAVPLPRATGNSFLPAWSPDGRLLAFSSSAWTPENPEIYAVRPDGKRLRRLTRTAGSAEVLGDDSWPAWSPDGTRIVFSSNRTGNGDVWIMRADGTGQRRLAGLARRDDWAPSFSPDGTQIAFHSLDAHGRSLLYVVRPNGTGLRSLGIAGTDPAWRPS
jgi:Tol biopolymer transport system component